MGTPVPEQLRAWAFVAGEDLESGLNFMSGCLDLRASRAKNGRERVVKSLITTVKHTFVRQD